MGVEGVVCCNCELVRVLDREGKGCEGVSFFKMTHVVLGREGGGEGGREGGRERGRG